LWEEGTGSLYGHSAAAPLRRLHAPAAGTGTALLHPHTALLRPYAASTLSQV